MRRGRQGIERILAMTVALISLFGLGNSVWSESSPPIHDCDRLAAHAFTPDKVADGVAWADLVADGAITACRRALESYPYETRFQAQLGRALRKAKSYTEARAFLRNAAGKGHVGAMNDLGRIYDKGYGVAQDHAEALRWYRKAADQGYPPGMTNLGVMYVRGHGVKQDHAEAVRWFRRAAEKGYAPGMTNLGLMYRRGDGIAQDYAEAIRWYRRAAEKGYARGMNNVGAMYANGWGVGQDHAEALRLYRKAADKGDALAMTNLGSMYARGEGVARDEAEAIRWYRKAAEKGIVRAKEYLRKRGVTVQPSTADTSTTKKSATSEVLEKLPDIEGLEKIR